MDTLRWFFFLTLAILLIASCNNAAAEFDTGRPATSAAEISALS